MTVQGFYQGEPGCFSEAAARQWRTEIPLQGLQTLQDVFDAVVAPERDFGVVPFHNTTAGDVPGARALLDDRTVAVVHRLALPVRMALLALPGTQLSDIDVVMSHPVALEQCSADGPGDLATLVRDHAMR